MRNLTIRLALFGAVCGSLFQWPKRLQDWQTVVVHVLAIWSPLRNKERSLRPIRNRAFHRIRRSVVARRLLSQLKYNNFLWDSFG